MRTGLASIGVALAVGALATLAGCGAGPIRARAQGAQSAQSGPCEVARLHRARVPGLLREGRLDRTVRVIEHADKLCPSTARASYAALLETLADLGRFDDVRAVADRVDADPSASPEARAAAKRAREKAGEPSADTGRGLLEEGLAARARGDLPAAQRLFDRAAVLLALESGASLALDFPNGLGFASALPWAGVPDGAARATSSGDPVFAASSSGRLLALADGARVAIVESATMRETLGLEGHRGDVTALAVSPDDKVVASASADRTVRAWTVATGKQVLAVETKEPVRRLWFAGDGGVLVGAHGAVSAWRVPGGAPLGRIDPEPGLDVFDVTPDGLVLAASSEAVQGRHLLSGRPVDELAKVRVAARSADGRLLAAASAREIALLRLPERTRIRKLASSAGAVRLAVSPDGAFVAAEDEQGSLRVWDARTDAPPRAPSGVKGPLFAVTKAGNVIVREGERALAVLDAMGTAPPRRLTFGAGRPLALAPNEDLVMGASIDPPRGLVAWSFETGAARAMPGSPHAESPTAIAMLDGGDATALAIAAGDRVLVLGLRTGELRVLDPSPPGVRGLAFLDGGPRLLAWSESKLMIWELPSGEVRKVADFESGRRRLLAVSADGSLAVVHEGRGPRLWDVGKDQGLASLDARPDAARPAIAIAPDRKTVAIAEAAGGVRLFAVESGAAIRPLGEASAKARALAFVRGGAAVAALLDTGAIAFWETASGRPAREPFGSEDDPVASIAPGAGGLLAMTDPAAGSARVHRLDDAGAAAKTFPSGLTSLRGAAVVGPARAVAVLSADQRTIGLYSADGRPIGAVRVVQGGATAYAIAPDRRYETFGDANGFNDAAVCRLGARTMPAAVCKERFQTVGLLRRLLVEGDVPNEP